MDHRRLAAMEPGTLHQSFLSAERKTSRTQRRYRDRGTTPNRAGGGDYLRLWAGVCEVLFGEWRLPLRSMPQKESSSSPENSLPRTDQISWWSQLRGTSSARRLLYLFDSLPFASTVANRLQISDVGNELGQPQRSTRGGRHKKETERLTLQRELLVLAVRIELTTSLLPREYPALI
jgi:hypothetical protein